jgi:hypothetical protein
MMVCKVRSDVDEMRGKRVLVFLRPQVPQTDFLVHAWQVLDISAGASAQFAFDPVVSARIATHSRRGNPIQSIERAVPPGHLLRITRPDALSPTLEPAPTGMAIDRLLPRQSGVYNQTHPSTSVDCVWHVSGSPVVTMPNLDWGMTCTFEYQPTFYFLIASPLLSGENFAVQAFTDMTPYTLKAGISTLDVCIGYRQGRWMFNFFTDLDEQTGP